MSNLYSEKILEHYKNPRNRGEMKDPTVKVTAVNPVCGDCTDFQLKIKDGKIEDIKFESLGCAVAIASASVLTEFVKGKNIEEAKKVTNEDLVGMLEASLSGYKVHCAGMSVDALHKAIDDYEKDN